MTYEKEIVEYQKMEKQLEAIMAQRIQLEVQLKEIENALKELDKVSSDEIYRSLGNILIKTTKEEAKKDLEEKKVLFSSRVKTFKEQEEQYKANILRLTKKLQRASDGQSS